MSKNIVIQELTASGYEELYPKTNASEVNFSDTTINQFLGGGEGAESALAYLSNFGKYWWRKQGKQTIYQLSMGVANSKILRDLYGEGELYFTTFDLSINETTGEYIKSNVKSHVADYFNNDGIWGCSMDGAKYYSSDVKNEKIITQITTPTFFDIGDGSIYYSSGYFYFTGHGQSYKRLNATETATVSKTTTQIDKVRYVYSNSSTTYPDKGNTQDGFSYWYIGSLLDALPEMGKVEYSSYLRTGASLTTLPLNFSRRPIFVALTPSIFTQTTKNAGIIWTGGDRAFWYYEARYQYGIDGQTVEITIPNDNYGIVINITSSYGLRLNVSGVTYNVFAITQ